MLNIDILKSFAAVARLGNFSRAAQSLGISQPTISDHIRTLETRLGAELLVRGHKKSELTNAGVRALETAERIIELSEELLQAAQSVTFKLGVSSNIMVYYIASHLASFSSVGISTEIKTNPQLAQALTSGGIDAAVMEWPLQQHGFESIKLFTDPLVLILHPEHPLAQASAISISQLRNLPLLGGESGSGTFALLRQALGKHAETLNISWSLGSTEAVKQAVMANVGASIVLAGSIEREVSQCQLVTVPIKGLSLQKSFYLNGSHHMLTTKRMLEVAEILKRVFHH